MAARQFAFVVFFAVVIAINAKPTNSDEGIFLTQVQLKKYRGSSHFVIFGSKGL